MTPQVLHYELDGGFRLTVNGDSAESARQAFDEALAKIAAEGRSFVAPPAIEVTYPGVDGRTPAIYWQVRTRGTYTPSL